MTEPLQVRWDRTVIHSTGPGDDTIVCCLDQNGRPVALFLDDELREALGLALLLPEGDGEVDQVDDEVPAAGDFPPSLGPTRDTPEREQQLEALARKLNQPTGW